MKRTAFYTGLYSLAFILAGTCSAAAATSSPALPTKAPSEITVGDTSKKQVIFTFDCGDGAQSAEGIMSALALHHVKGTFFVTGTFTEAYPEIVRHMVRDGNEVFNHTYSHPRLTTLTDAQVTQELAKLDQTVYRVAGTSTLSYFRPPYGDRDLRVRTAAARIGYRSVYWTIDTLDWREPAGMTAARVKARILANIKPGTIFLMHAGDTITGSILDSVLTEVEKRGYKAVSLAQGL